MGDEDAQHLMSSRIPAQLRESLALLLLILVNLHLQLHCLTSAPLSPFRGSILSRVMLDENILISVRKPRDSAGILGAGSSCPSRSSFPVNVSTDSELQEFVKFWLTRKSNCIPKPQLFTAANHSAVLRGAQNQNPVSKGDLATHNAEPHRFGADPSFL